MLSGCTPGAESRSDQSLYRRLEAQAARDPEAVALTAAERHQVLVAWNATKSEYPRDRCLHELFEAQVERTPDAVAVVADDGQLTYGELNRRANRLAHCMRKLGVGPDVPVGLCLERSAGLVVGLLGILKAGGAYLPLDPGYPKERLTFMLDDTRAPVVVTQELLAGSLPEYGGAVVHLDADPDESTPASADNPASGAGAENLAYVIYTSGSTGRPKGVQVPHRAIVNLLVGLGRQLGLTSRDALLAVTTVTFDIAALELFLPLVIGARVALAGREVAADGGRLRQRLATSCATVMQATPATWRLLLGAGWRGGPEFKVLCGGEALDRDLADRLLEGGAEVWNLYGPTETTVWSTAGRVEAGGGVSIGRPIANTRVYLLDPALNPVPVGVPGELYVGGDGLARGYLDRSELTAEKFIPDPFSDAPGARLYRTGDLARWLPDGNLACLGRIDHQIKLRGYRIEPGEIEAALVRHPRVYQAVVLAREDEPGDAHLVAYVVPDRRPAPGATELRGHLRAWLPEYMLPAAFVPLEALPLTPNGKLDRRALPPPDRARPELDEAYATPRDSVEAVLAGLWADVLGLKRVGLRDNFFDLGGHSLLATRLVSRVRDTFQLELPVRALFEAPTVADLAERARVTMRAGPGPLAPPPRRVTRDGQLPLSFAQQRLWFLEQLEPGTPTYNLPYALRLSGPLDAPALKASLAEIVRRHEALRTTFPSADGQPAQVIGPRRSVGLAVVDLRALPTAERAAEASRLAAEEARRPFDLARGPLIRASLLWLADDEHVLLLTLHHIVADGWSLGVLFRELGALYAAFAEGRPSPLPELPLQYAEHAAWQREWLQGAVLEAQLAYWRQQLAGVPALELPTDRPRPAVRSFRGAQESLTLDQDLLEALEGLGRREGVTLFMLLLGALNLLLYRYTGQRDVVVGAPVAGRKRRETEGLIGLFLNNLVLRTDLSGNPTFRELLARVRAVALDAYAHQDVPFERVVADLQPERDLSRTPLFQVFLNVYLDEQYPAQLGGLAVELLPTEVWSNFDLTVYVRRRHGRVVLSAIYSPALFEGARIRELLRQLEQLLSQVVRSPAERIDRFSLVTPSARAILPDPRAELPEPRYPPLTTLFAAWAERTPTAPAVRQGDRTWTYRELAERAHLLADTLLARGLEAGDVVALTGPRSFGLIAGLLAGFSSGGVLLPLDPSLPATRRRLMLREAGAKHLLRVGAERPDGGSALELPWLAPIPVDAETGRALGGGISRSRGAPPPELSPDDPAYIFFTSGTTGLPKAVLGCHKGLSHFLDWQRQAFGVGPGDRCAQLTSLSFDPLLRDVFLPLTSGATVCLPEDSDELGHDRLVLWLEREAISLLHTTPSRAQAWLAEVPAGVGLPALRWLFFAGDPLTEALVRRWRRAFPASGGIVNLYGPTETTMVKCCYIVPADPPPGGLPVGWPLPQGQALVLAGSDRLCGIGEAGEIVLRTPFRTRGYLNAPDEQRERFVANPFRDDERDLLYATGDLGRYRPDGSLEILGRLDDQVKIRGVRVEPGEVAATLSRHPAVEACVVVARQDAQDQPVLAAYVAPSKQAAVTVAALRAHLGQQLPAVMIPATFTFVEHLPLTPNGKVDRAALPAPEPTRPDLGAAFVAPRTPVEATLAGLWAEVLGLERVGIDDDFFRLGGHSLLAIQVLSRMREAFRVELPLRGLFQAPTVAGLALAVVQAWTERADTAELGRLLGELEGGQRKEYSQGRAAEQNGRQGDRRG